VSNGSRSILCLVRGPVMLIAVGALFVLDHNTEYSFSHTWPLLLILLGLLKLLERVANTSRQPDQPVSGGGSQ
jgi:hypothetical protein